MSRSKSLFIAAFVLILAAAYIIPKSLSSGTEDPADTSEALANQAAIFYLQMKESGTFELEKYITATRALRYVAPQGGLINLTIAYVRFLEGQKQAPERGVGPGWELLAYLRDETDLLPDNAADLDMEVWVHLALLERCYEKADLGPEASQVSIDLKFLENRLDRQGNIASLVEILSLMGLALLIQSLFQWKAAKKLHWDMYAIETLDVPMAQIAKLMAAFFVGYLGLQFLLAPLGSSIWILLLGYVMAIVWAWWLLRLFWFPSSKDIVVRGGLDQVVMNVSTAIHAIFGFCILVFLSRFSAFILHWIDWPFDQSISNDMYRQLLGTQLSAWGMVGLTCILAPIAEEFFFRGLLLKSLSGHTGKWLALCWSSLLFAVFHPLSFFPLVFILGLCLGLVYMRSRNLMAPILTHVLWNAFTVFQIQMGL